MTNSENQPQKEPQRQPYYDEKTEEKFEKEDEKREEKTNRDPLSAIAWALILIWAGLVFLAQNLGWLDQIQFQVVEIEGITLTGISTWAVIMIGAGVIVFFEAIIRTFVPAYRSSTGGNFFLAAIFLGIGLGSIFGWTLVWPFILIAMGLSALASALIQRR
ncbi:MAG: hypothetical protein RQ728_06880 [Brevefilum sp.]|nr:hypothetical protein [Brevefilum sp.]MDT8381966.1 hypothetical protein [Brevefilum sp.]